MLSFFVPSDLAGVSTFATKSRPFTGVRVNVFSICNVGPVAVFNRGGQRFEVHVEGLLRALIEGGG